MKKIIIILLTLSILSCVDKNPKIIIIGTDLVEVIPYIDYFNKTNQNIKIVIKNTFSEAADLYIYNGINTNPPFTPYDLKSFVYNEININSFYTDIVIEEQNNTIPLLPLSFNVSGVIYNKNQFSNLNSIDIDQFLNQNSMKFSPSWSNNFISWLFLINRPILNSNANYLDSEILLKTMNDIIAINKKNETEWDITDFNKKYLYLSPVYLIEKKLIDYYFYQISDYIKLKDKNIGFSFLTKNNLIYSNEKMTYIGISNDSKRIDESKYIIKWMLNRQNQIDFLKDASIIPEMNNLFLGGLSVIPEVNNIALGEYYPQLVNLIPNSNSFTSFKKLPNLWESLKKEVYEPLFKQMYNYNQDQLIPLYLDLYNDWYKKNNK
ncbi:MAG: hypothetical protein JXR64_12020 [Spirochaetales bacterium]|nr:hypothetical protein [Spirochaetales bacterium]